MLNLFGTTTMLPASFVFFRALRSVTRFAAAIAFALPISAISAPVDDAVLGLQRD